MNGDLSTETCGAEYVTHAHQVDLLNSCVSDLISNECKEQKYDNGYYRFILFRCTRRPRRQRVHGQTRSSRGITLRSDYFAKRLSVLTGTEGPTAVGSIVGVQ